jgi:hypothetical protein
MQRALLTLALIATAGVSYAQQPMPTSEPTDPYGRPLIGRNDWVRQPGDRAGPSGAAAGPAMNANMAPAPQMQMAPQAQPMAPQMAAQPMDTAQTGPRQSSFKDEYGFRYDAQGNRLDARGNIISPHTR